MKKLTDLLPAAAHPSVDVRSRAYLTPVRVALCRGNVQNAESLLRDLPRQILFEYPGAAPCTLKGAGATVVLDFGRELHGGAEISVFEVIGAADARLHIRFGESVSEAMSTVYGDDNATNDHATRDTEIRVRNWSMSAHFETGFRFLSIELSDDVEVRFHTVKAVIVYRDIPYIGSFESSDPLLDRIWETGAYTVHLNMQQYIWDGVKRDRLVWIGDLHPEISSIMAVFGDQSVIRDSLDFAAAHTPPDEWMNNLPSYSMWWLIILFDYYRQYGDKDYLARHLDYVTVLCRHLAGFIDENGKDSTPQNRFLDWPTQSNPRATDAGLQSLHILATRAAREIFLTMGRDAEAAACARDLSRLEKCPVECGGAKQAAAFMVLAGLANAKETDREVLSVGGAAGFSTFTGFYVLQAMAKAENFAGALDAIRAYWGGMLSLGATTFWEDFDLAWLKNAAPIDRLPKSGEIDVHGAYGNYCYKGFRHSLCHGWASGVTPFLSRYILGIEVTKPGCTEITVTPHLCDLSFAKGTYPTPFGTLFVEHRKDAAGKVHTTVKAPAGVSVIVNEQ